MNKGARSYQPTAALLGLAVVAGASSPPVSPIVAEDASRILSVRRDAQDPTTVIGTARVSAPAPAIWARLQQVDRWRELFSDVRKLEVRKHEGGRWRVRLDSAIFKCGPHDYVMRFEAPWTMRLDIEAPGIDAGGAIVLTAGADPGQTRAEYRLRVKVGRVAGWFVSEADVRGRQERLVEKYLRDLVRAFPGLPGDQP